MVYMVNEEFNNVQSWVAKSNLKIHSNTTKEIIFSQRRNDRAQFSSEPFISEAERVIALRVLGVVPTLQLVMGAHPEQVLTMCASSQICSLHPQVTWPQASGDYQMMR